MISQWLYAGWERLRKVIHAQLSDEKGQGISRAKVLKWCLRLGAAGVGFLLLLSIFIYLGLFGRLPNYAELRHIRNNTASEVYSEDGTLLGKYYVENRVNADFEEISPNVIHALIATEDARFFEHGGIDFRAWARVLVKSILLADESSGGGSTLSQQLAKNLYPRRSYWFFSTLINKLRETFVARRLEKIYTKEELLNLYLNTVPFSEDIYGIKVAAQRFFNKSPQKLPVEEAAVLVGMLKGNTLYNPARNPERALQRRNTVLSQMVKYGYLDRERLDSLQQLPLEVKYYKEGRSRGLGTYFREHLRLELEKILADFPKPDGSSYNLFTDGLKIYTTIDARLQRYAEEAVTEYMPRVQESFNKNWKNRKPWDNDDMLDRLVRQSDRYKALKAGGASDAEIGKIFNTPVRMRIFSWAEGEEIVELSPLDSIKYYLTLLNTGLLAMEPKSGLVRAWVGGTDFGYVQYDHVKARRQVGSTFKPIVYAAALRQGMLPCEYTENQQVSYPEFDNWEPKNSDGEYGGVFSMEGALSHSVNTVTVEIMMRTGLEPVRDLARSMGISGTIPKVPSISLGTVEASLLDMVRVYGTFANDGRRPELHYLDRIETADGEVLVKFARPDPDRFEQVLTPEQAGMMVHMLESVVDSGTARRLHYEYGLYGDIAGKTGTTQDQSDGWFVGFTSNLVAGVWVGAESPRIHFRTMGAGQGSSTALPIWGRMMRKVYKDSRLSKRYRGQFTPLPDSLLALMQCPPYLDEMPVIAGFDPSQFQDYQEFYEAMGDFEQAELDEMVQLRPRRQDESYEEYAARLKRFYERQERQRQRREKRKEFWSEVLFGKKEKDDNN